MYSLRAAYRLPSQLELPTTMYPLRGVHSSDGPGDGPVLPVIQDKRSILQSGDMEKRWDQVLQQLQELKLQLADIRRSVQKVEHVGSNQPCVISDTNLQVLNGCVINADPARPPYSLLLLRSLQLDLNLAVTCHAHSTTPVTPQLDALSELFSTPSNNDSSATRIFIIWRKGLVDPELVLNRVKGAVVLGEVNILRYLARIGAPLGYHDDDVANLLTDAVLDTCHLLTHTTALKQRQLYLKDLETRLGGAAYLGGRAPDVCDVAAWAAIKAAGPALTNSLQPTLLNWHNSLSLIVK